MHLSHAAADSLFRAGKFQHIVSDLKNHSRIEQLTADHRLLLADTLLRTGAPDLARTIAEPLVRGSISEAARDRREMILGLVAREFGNLTEATQRLQHSARLARERGDLVQAGLSSMMAFRIISERQPPNIVGPLLADIRSLTTRAGDPHLTILLHETVARQETQAGNLDEARRHLRIATGLLKAHPNAWLEQNCAINAFCIEFSTCDFLKAREHLERAAFLIAETGAFKPRIINNQGHLDLELGNTQRAEQTLESVIEKGSGDLLECGLEGRARLLLVLGRLAECERDLRRLRDLQDEDGAVSSFAFRASLLTKVRLRIHQQRWLEAAQDADVAIQEGQRVSDRNTIAVAQFLKGQALASSGSPRKAAAALCIASDLGCWGIREYQSAFSEMTAALLQGVQDALAHPYLERASRVRRAHTHRPATEAPLARTDSKAFADLPGRISAANIASALARTFDLSYSPRLIGDELICAIDSLGCSEGVKLVETRSADERRMGADGCTLRLGEERGKSLLLRCGVPADPTKALLLGDILRVGRAALALERYRQDERNRAALWPADPVSEQGGALFVSEEMQALLATAKRIAPTDVPILITGETGTGKEVLARTIHALSNRAKSTFLPFNCTSTPRDMLDSQLFGHRRGSFTGATDHFQGVIRASSHGTLFLDEIGDMSLEVQPKILRFLESNEVHPIGETQPQRVDVRVIAATNIDLDTLVNEGRFRDDLFYRLTIVRLHLPPLRQRRVEIPSLAHHYLQKYADEYRKADLRLAEETMEYLVLFRWPGNVRQLANEMRRLAALAEPGAVLMPEHLSPDIAASRRTIPASNRVLDATEVVVRVDQPLPAAMQHLERAMLKYALEKTGGRMEAAASLLGVSRKGLYLKRQRFGIEPAGEKASSTQVA
jgi:DNA-binding NtrC family response regulator/tetratricopeptide (TPR) repeat protein